MKVLVYPAEGYGLSDSEAWDASTPEKEEAAFLRLFENLEEEFDHDFGSYNLGSELQGKAVEPYQMAKKGHMTSAREFLEILNEDREVKDEMWELVEIKDPSFKGKKADGLTKEEVEFAKENEKHLPEIPKDRVATVRSLQHWLRMYLREELPGEHIGESSCDLCKTYKTGKVAGGCGECPLRKAFGVCGELGAANFYGRVRLANKELRAYPGEKVNLYEFQKEAAGMIRQLACTLEKVSQEAPKPKDDPYKACNDRVMKLRDIPVGQYFIPGAVNVALFRAANLVIDPITGESLCSDPDGDWSVKRFITKREAAEIIKTGKEASSEQ